MPRIALTAAISEDVSVYAQIAVGNNPSGANPEWLNLLTIEAIGVINQEIVDGTISLANSIPGTMQEEFDNYIASVFYDENTFLTYGDEEIINYEVGLNTSLSDNSMQVTMALYYQDWSIIGNGANVNFNPTNFGGMDINNADYLPGAQGNGGDNRLIGWDSSINWQMTNSFSLNMTLLFHDNTATDFCNVGATGFGLENN